MKHLKLFESFSNFNKIEAANNILVRFIIVNRLKTLNLKSITIEIDTEEKLIFCYSKNNAGERLHGFIREKDGYRIGYFSVDFSYHMFTSPSDSLIKIPLSKLQNSKNAKGIETYFNLDKVKLTNSSFIKKKYDAYIDMYENHPPIDKGGFSEKLIRWLDSGKETSKVEFMIANRFIKAADVWDSDFEIPKNYYQGYFSQELSRLRKLGLIDLVRRGKDFIMVKGKNFDKIKAKKGI